MYQLNTIIFCEMRARIAHPFMREASRGDLFLQKCDWDGSGKKWKNCGLKNTPEHQQLIAAKK